MPLRSSVSAGSTPWPAIGERPAGDIAGGIWDFARGYAQLRRGDPHGARQFLDRVLTAAASSTAVFRFHPAQALLGTLGAILEGEIKRADGNLAAAIAAFERAVSLQDSLIVDDPEPLPFAARHWLGAAAKPMGAHLFECAGNNNPANFGLMSVAEWDGVPLTTIVSRLKPAHAASALLVAGLDHAERSSADSIPGASWILPLASLPRLGAFLAVRMNREALPADHGKPVRLVVPGWYGCAWIKWVNELRLVSDREPATSQMKEFAGRTHQSARHDLAADYTAPDIQTAATPIRVEKRRVPGGLEYRIVGIVWGGIEARGSAGHPFWPRRSVETLLNLPETDDARRLVAVGVPLASRVPHAAAEREHRQLR